MSIPNNLIIKNDETVNDKTNEIAEPTNTLTGLDSSCAWASAVESNKVLYEQLMFEIARSLIQFAQLFISQYCQPVDPTRPHEQQLNLRDKFEDYLNSLKGKQRVSWTKFNQTLDQTELEKDPLIGQFVTLVFGEEYQASSAGIHNLELHDLFLFRRQLDKTEIKSFQVFKAEWESLVDLLIQPGNFEACVKQKMRLFDMKKILN